MVEDEFKFISPGEIRTRMAPAPTGLLHIGTARTTLFNYLFAKQHQGSFILRIEDTDIGRSKREYEEDILNSLRWLGIEWDEGPDIGGDYGPYRQSERKEIYTGYLRKLLKEGRAYYCFCSKEDREAQKQYLMSIGQPPIYNGKCADLSSATVKKYLKASQPSIIRLKVPKQKIIFEDLIREKIEIDTETIGDFAIAKNLDSPLYNFACAIDDFEMKISHIIRGEDHLSNTPKQILIQEALDFPKVKYAHLPMILAPDRTKLSKRHGAVGISEYRRKGYLPEAIVNLIAFLGWNPGTEREIYSLPGLIKDFSLERVKKAGAVFNIKRLNFLNGFYIRQKPIDKLTEMCVPFLVEAGLITPTFLSEQYPPALGGMDISQRYKISESGAEISFEKLQRIVSIYKERLKYLSEITDLADFFFRGKLEYKKELLQWREMTEEEVKLSLDKSEKTLSKIDDNDWRLKSLFEKLIPEAQNFNQEISKPPGDRGYLLWPLRVALSGKEASPSPFEIAEILGNGRTLERIKEAKSKLRET